MIIDDILENEVPTHVAVIMDGNRRWAKKKLLAAKSGHKEGAKKVIELVRTSVELNIKYLTIYAFSTENWSRDKKEVEFLMSLLVDFVKSELDYLHQNNVKIKLLGNIDDLPEKTKEEVKKSINLTKNNTKLVLSIALSYGSRLEIVDAIKNIATDVKNNTIKIDQINENIITDYLYTKDIPDPDLMIRTSGEMRLSNFLLYQMAYTEFYFSEVLWPDFDKNEYLKAIYNFQQRKRRYGN